MRAEGHVAARVSSSSRARKPTGGKQPRVSLAARLEAADGAPSEDEEEVSLSETEEYAVEWSTTPGFVYFVGIAKNVRMQCRACKASRVMRKAGAHWLIEGVPNQQQDSQAHIEVSCQLRHRVVNNAVASVSKDLSFCIGSFCTLVCSTGTYRCSCRLRASCAALPRFQDPPCTCNSHVCWQFTFVGRHVGR